MQTVSRLIDTFIPTHYDLSLDIDGETKTFRGTVTIEGSAVSDAPLRLHAKDLMIETVTVDGHQTQFSAKENDELEVVYDQPKTGNHIIVVGFSGTITDQMHGMYPCYYKHEGIDKKLFATQFESHHAREVFPCIDEPAAKATFDVTLTTEDGLVVLSNMPTKHQSTEEGRLVTSFQRTPKMSVYLLAWVYGELHKKSATTKSNIEVNLSATPAQPAEALDFGLDIAVRGLEFFEDYFGVPYPLPKCDHVALPDFSSGAMENWGLITYREVALLAEPGIASVSSRHLVAMVICHELSHQWFGNLVTMKWWNNLWLNESFANLMEYLGPDHLHPEWKIWDDFNSQEVVMALRRDAIPGVQPVQVDVHHPDEITTLFDPAIVYAKGGRLMRMLEKYLGEANFRAGLERYFKQYSYQNTEEHDLWTALSAASGKDITSFMTTWISQPGFPVVHATQNGLTQEQFFIGPHEPTNALWPIPLAATDPGLPQIFDEREISVVIKPGTLLNADSSAHFITHYSPELLQPLIEQVRRGTMDETGRFQLLHEQTLLARAGIIPTADLVGLLSAYEKETTETVWGSIAITVTELKKFVENDPPSEAALKALAGRLASEQFARLGWDPHTDETESDSKLRATIIGLMVYSENPDVLVYASQQYASHQLSDLNPELRGLILGAVVRYSATPEIIDALLRQYQTVVSADVQHDICGGLTASKDPVVIEKLLETLTTEVRNQDVARWFVYLIRNRDSRELAWQWMKNNWAWIEQTFGGDKSFDDYPRYGASGLVSRQQLEDYRAFFGPLSSITALKRVIAMGISEIEGRVELIERDSEAVRSALLQQ